MSKKDKKVIYIYSLLAILVLVALFVFQDKIFGQREVGSILIPHLESNTTIFVDSVEEKRISSSKDNIKIKNIDAGIHSILVSRDGFWPWLKEVEIVTGEELILEPFFVLQNSGGLIITKDDPEYGSLIGILNKVLAPGFNSKKISSDKNIAVWVDGGSLFTEWLGSEDERPDYFCNEFGCHNVVVPLGFGGTIRNVDFYKNRNDVFIVSFGNGVFVLEADATGNQNFQPIFEGDSPNFILGEEDSIYIKDNNFLYQVAI